MGCKTKDETKPKEVKLPDFIIIPFEILQADLKPTELKVLICLYSFRSKSTNTVWPKLETIALRLGKPATYSNEVSRTISSLRDKGYLRTLKKAFGKSNKYELCLPGEKHNVVEIPQGCNSQDTATSTAPVDTGLQEADDSAAANVVEIPQGCNIDSPETLENSNVVENPNIGENPQINLVENPQANVVENPQAYKKSTKNKPTEHNKLYKTPSLNKYDFSTWPTHPDEQILSDWIAVRKQKKAALTQTAINLIAKELHQAASFGLSVNDCIGECCVANWVSFQLEWYLNRHPALREASQIKPGRSTRERTLAEDLTNTNW